MFFHFKYGNGDEAFYSIQEREEKEATSQSCYKLTAATQQFVLDCSHDEQLTTKLLTFEFSNKIEEFLLVHSYSYVGEFHYGELVTTVPDRKDLFERIRH